MDELLFSSCYLYIIPVRTHAAFKVAIAHQSTLSFIVTVYINTIMLSFYLVLWCCLLTLCSSVVVVILFTFFCSIIVMVCIRLMWVNFYLSLVWLLQGARSKASTSKPPKPLPHGPGNTGTPVSDERKHLLEVVVPAYKYKFRPRKNSDYEYEESLVLRCIEWLEMQCTETDEIGPEEFSPTPPDRTETYTFKYEGPTVDFNSSTNGQYFKPLIS